MSVVLCLAEDAFICIHHFSIPAIISTLPRSTIETMTGNLLGDGGIHYPNLKRNGKATGNARFGMTMAAAVHNYISTLFNSVYAQYSTPTGLHP